MTRLHIGSGSNRLEGWINIDRESLPGVDRVLDVTRDLPYIDVRSIFAEHFIEHLSYENALELLKTFRRILNPDGILRLSTPNLDWVWASHYRSVLSPEEEILGCFGINRAFRGWGHQFLYNFGTLAASLREAGFREVVRCQYGQSDHPELRGLEQHEQNEDYQGISHILIVEAWGSGGRPPEYFTDPKNWYLRDVQVS